ncbi:MAG: VCBS repeat-containing protein [Planctomycetes bacterium]|nr:VCBS repeat-containing protein [Planctomycetota bacterium]
MIHYSQIDNLTIGLGSGDETFTVRDTQADTTTTITAGYGANSFFVRGTSGTTIIKTASDDLTDTIVLGSRSPGPGSMLNRIQGAVGVVGSGIDDVVVDDSGDRNTRAGTLTASSLLGLGMGPSGLTYSGISRFDISLGAVNDFLHIMETHQRTAYTVAANAGDDTISLGAGDIDTLMGHVVVSGGEDLDRITVNDTGNGKDANYRLTPTALTTTPVPGAQARAFAGIRYDGTTETLSLAGTDAANTFSVLPSKTTRYEINGGLPSTGTVPPRLGDALFLDLEATADQFLTMLPKVPGSGVWQFGNGMKPVAFESIERLNDYLVPVFSDSGISSKAAVKVFDALSGWLKFEIPAEQIYGTTTVYGVNATMGDLTGDGVTDLVVGPSRGIFNPSVHIFDGTTGQFVQELRPYADSQNSLDGISVAVGDIDGDGWNDLVVAPASDVAQPIRVYSGDPSRYLTRIGADLWPVGEGAAAGLSVLVMDEFVNGAAHRGQLVVGADFGGASSIQSFRLDVDGQWSAVPSSRFQPFGNIAGGVPILTAGDATGDGVQDLFVSLPKNDTGDVRIFDGSQPGSQLEAAFATLYQPQSISGVRMDAFDFNGDGMMDKLTVFRSSDGITTDLIRYTTSGERAAVFSTSVSDFMDLDGFWNISGEFAFVTQSGNAFTVEYEDGRMENGTINGDYYLLSSSNHVVGNIVDKTIDWYGGAISKRFNLSGTYEIDGTMVRLQQQRHQLRMWTPTGELFVATITADGRIVSAASPLVGQFNFLSQTAVMSDSTEWRKVSLSASYNNDLEGSLRVFETRDGRTCFIDRTGRTALGVWIDYQTIEIKDWDWTLSVAPNQLTELTRGKLWLRQRTDTV